MTLLQLQTWCSCITQRKRVLYGPVKHNRSAFDLFVLCLGSTNGFVKFCKAHEQRLRLNLHDFRVIRADAEGVTLTLTLADSLLNGLNREEKMRPMKIDMQFLNHRRKQYLDLHADLILIDYSFSSKSACCTAATTIGPLLSLVLFWNAKSRCRSCS